VPETKFSPRTLVALLAALVSLAAFASEASAGVVERVCAVVGDRPILLTDLRERARPFLLRVHAQVPAGAQRAAASSEVFKAVLDRMIDEELERRAASRSNIVVSSAEVDEALARVAAQNNVTPEVVVSEATKSGLTERQYRDELRRQILEAKLMNLRLQGRLRVTLDDLKVAYRKQVIEERRRLSFRLAWVVLDAKQRALAEQLVARARAGTDFGSLARAHSRERSSAQAGGLLATMKPGKLLPALDRAALRLEIGEVSAPIRVDNELFILKLVERAASRLPSFEQAKNELEQRVYLDKMQQARKHWLDGLRRRTHIEVRC
jgi:peptidyl-prolyl cis-trans isomerase SurA